MLALCARSFSLREIVGTVLARGLVLVVDGLGGRVREDCVGGFGALDLEAARLSVVEEVLREGHCEGWGRETRGAAVVGPVGGAGEMVLRGRETASSAGGVSYGGDYFVEIRGQ